MGDYLEEPRVFGMLYGVQYSSNSPCPWMAIVYIPRQICAGNRIAPLTNNKSAVLYVCMLRTLNISNPTVINIYINIQVHVIST